MTIKELIEQLSKLDPNATVMIAMRNHDGFESSGYGETALDVDELNDDP
jgi:hypothetical protein